LIVSLVSVGTNVRYILPSNYCMFYYVSMRLISTSINQWLLWFCLASLRSCYRNDLFDLLRTRRYPHGCVKPLAVEAISYVSISYHVKDCIS